MKDLSRKQLQSSLAQGVEMALATVPAFRADDVDHLRRFMRAMVHIGAARLLDAGAPPAAIVAYCIEALAHEVEARKAASVEATVEAEGIDGALLLPAASA